VKYDKPFSNLAFKFNLCRYTQERRIMDAHTTATTENIEPLLRHAREAVQSYTDYLMTTQEGVITEMEAREAGAYTRPLLSST
jgi:hypothetical protein